MKPQERFDIVVCARNSEATIATCLERIQKYVLPSRLIVIDGNSTDRTTQLASEMGAEVYSDKGKGLGYARNMALRLVRTPVFGFIDADAFIPKNWVSLLTHMEDPRVAAASATTIYGYGNPPLQKLQEWMAKTTKKEDAGFVSTLVRKSAVLDVGGIREDLQACEDWELRSRLELRGLKWIWDRSIVTRHPQSLTVYLVHVRGWGYGARRSGMGLNTFIMAFLRSPYWAVRLSTAVHPIHLIYYPLIRLFYLLGYVKGSKSEPRQSHTPSH